MVRFAVESWAPEYGSSTGDDGAMELDPKVDVDATVELPLSDWRPLRPEGDSAARDVLFVDGVQRIDARLWFEIDGQSSAGIAASYAAGVVRCGDKAVVEGERAGRGVFALSGASGIESERVRYEHFPTASGEPEVLQRGIQEQMGRLEIAVAAEAGPAEILFHDGPLRGSENIPGAIGYIKSHRAGYLPPAAAAIVGQLRAGERTPLFLVQKAWSRFSWYLRLPMDLPGHPWAGIARCELVARGPIAEAVEMANRSTATLQRFASTPHKDTRAPQNLFPIAGLENHLRRRLGDRDFVYRQLLKAAASARQS
jgi:hypothetical protein